jgi:hypothetical protein
MKYTKVATGYQVGLSPGEDVFASLAAFAKKEGIASATLSGLGGVKDIEVGYYELSEKKYHFKTYPDIYELVGMNGNITQVAGAPVAHIHATFSGHDNAVFGGHVNSMICGLSVEIHVIPHGVTIERKLDDDSGLKLMELEHPL